MAEKRPVQGADSIIRDIKERRFSPIYILMGDESYYIDKISDTLSSTVLQPEERDFNQTILFGRVKNADSSSFETVGQV